MSITDELREWFKDRFFMANGWQEIHAIADRIDAEHQKAMSRAGQLLADAEKDRDYNYANWQECKQKVLQGNITFDELNAKIEHLMDELSHRIELPKDADGEYIHVGERVQLIGNDPSTVSHMSLADDGWRVYVKYDGGIGTGSGEPKHIRHHHAPTVEDVLREFAAKLCIRDGFTEATEETFAEYAAKLRLAEGEDA